MRILPTALVLVCATPALPQERSSPVGQNVISSNVAQAKSAIQKWPDSSQRAAKEMIQKYGPPQEVTALRLIWTNNWPWKRTTVYRDAIAHRFPVFHNDVLEQTISYRVPTGKFDELATFEGSLVADRTNGELSARSDSEPMNLLALNLANDIAHGKQSVKTARVLYLAAVRELKQGKTSSYAQRLAFSPLPPANTIDPEVHWTPQCGQFKGPCEILNGEYECCNDRCVDINFDDANCGGCNVPCSGRHCCVGTCVDISTDPNNCGSCGNIVSPGMVCTNGQPDLPPPQALCKQNGTLVPLATATSSDHMAARLCHDQSMNATHWCLNPDPLGDSCFRAGGCRCELFKTGNFPPQTIEWAHDLGTGITDTSGQFVYNCECVKR